MKNIIEELHQQFYAETNIEISVEDNDYCSLQIYAQWLENLTIDKLNKDMILENKNLRNAFYQVMDILENGLTMPLSD
ncbi:MAG: hypothetical protein WC860_02460 [Candidatus Margulisiibacteriota bacterium]|jgi:hypothetical protein